jgi:Protein of unknown function (DUF1573)
MRVLSSSRLGAAFAAAALAPVLFCQATVSRPAVSGSLVFAEVQHDFGRVRDDRPVEWKFTFTNRATTPVTITQVRTSCGCTTTALAKKSYGPGESGEISASFNPANRQGKERKTIKVATDDAQAGEIELAILVEVIPRIGIEPAAVFLGELRFDAPVPANLVRPFTITSRVPAFEIKGAKIDDPRFTMKALDPVPAEADGDKITRYPYEVSLAGNLPLGRHQTMLRIATNDATRKEITVPVIVESVGDLRIAPSPMAFQMPEAGAPVEQMVTVMARNGKPFHILEAKATSPQMTLAAEVEQVAKNSELAWRVRVRGTSPAAGATVSGSLKLKTDSPSQPEIEVPITGYVLRPSQKH